MTSPVQSISYIAYILCNAEMRRDGRLLHSLKSSCAKERCWLDTELFQPRTLVGTATTAAALKALTVETTPTA